MRLRNFLVITGIWVALLPHVGFSIATENVLFSITGFLFIVVSFYVAAVEDKHKHKRIIQDGDLKEKAQHALGKLKAIKKEKRSAVTHVTEEPATPEDVDENTQVGNTSEMKPELEEDTGPRIKKAQSDVKIDMKSLDDIVS